MRKKKKYLYDMHPLDRPLSKTLKPWEVKYNAPAGQIWVCGACGKSNVNRVRVGDESCFLNAVLCWGAEGFKGPWVAVEEEKPQEYEAEGYPINGGE